MGRPQITLSPEQVVEVETLAALLNQDQIADYFGIGRRTFRAICARDEEVMIRYKRGKAKAIAHVANGLLQKARAGCKTSSIFYLKTQAGWRETAEIQHSGNTVTHITREIVSPRERLKTLLDKMAARIAPDGADPRIEDEEPDAAVRGHLVRLAEDTP